MNEYFCMTKHIDLRMERHAVWFEKVNAKENHAYFYLNNENLNWKPKCEKYVANIQVNFCVYEYCILLPSKGFLKLNWKYNFKL